MNESISDDDLFDADNTSSFATHNGQFGRPRLDSRMSVCLPSKGLFNAPGENNCFLNASVQILWHLNVFRRSFRLLDGHTCLGNACIFCALKQIFQDFEDSEAVALAPDILRLALANAFMDDQRFQLGRMDDAAECFENILSRLHGHIAHKEYEDSCSATFCIPHQKFALHILEQTSCECQATSEPKFFYQFVTYVSASVLVDQANSFKEVDESFSFGQLIRSSQSGETRPCPDEKRCYYKNSGKNTTTVQTTLINKPDIVTIGIIWDTDSPSAKYIKNLLDCVGENQNIFLVDMFDNIPDDQYRRLEMKLVGLIAYYGKHYVSFFYNNREEQWVYFDDAHVKQVGHSWEDVVGKCKRNRFQPLLIVYSNSGGTPVDSSQAPKQTETISKELFLNQPEKSPTRRPHKHRRRKKNHGRSRSHSPADSLTSPADSLTSPTEETHGQTLSPKPRRKHHHSSATDEDRRHSSPRSPRRHQSKPKNSNKYKVNKDESFEELQFDFNDKENNLPKQNNLSPSSEVSKHVMHTSASDGCISAKSMSNGFVEQENPHDRRRSGSTKKKLLGNVIKNINPRNKKSKPKNDGFPLNDDLQDEPAFADICFYSPPSYKKSTNSTTQDSLYKQDNQHDNNSQDSNTTTTKQLTTLRKHQDVLNSSFDSPTHSRSNSPKPPIPNSALEDDFIEGVDNHHHRHNNNGTEEVLTNGDDGDLIHFNSRPEVVTLPPPSYGTYKRRSNVQGKFERLVNEGEQLLLESEEYEKNGDIFLAVERATAATAKFRSASKLEDINESLIQFVDDKRWFSHERSKKLNSKANELITSGGPIYAQETSDSASVSDVAVEENIGSSTRSDIDDNRMEDLISLQNHNANLQAMARLSIQPNPTLPTHNHLTDSKPQTNTQTDVSKQRTAIQWVVDKPNDTTNQNKPSSNQLNPINNRESEKNIGKPADSLRSSMQRNPKLYNPAFYSSQTLPPSSSSFSINPKSQSNSDKPEKLLKSSSFSVNTNKSRTSHKPSKPTAESDRRLILPQRPDAVSLTSKEKVKTVQKPRTDKVADAKTSSFRTADLFTNPQFETKMSLPSDVSSPSSDDSPRETIYDDIIKEKPAVSRTKSLINRLNQPKEQRETIEQGFVSHTLEKFKKERSSSQRCSQCKWRSVDIKDGSLCQECRATALSNQTTTATKEIDESSTLERLRKNNRIRCIQCGWRYVDTQGGCCEACQSEYL